MYIYCIRLQINKHVCLSVCLSPPPPPTRAFHIDRDTRCDKSRRHVAGTSHLVCTAAATRLWAYLVAAICRTNLNHFEFVRQIAATKLCRSDNHFHMSHGTICRSNLSRRRVAAICRIVCLGFIATGRLSRDQCLF